MEDLFNLLIIIISVVVFIVTSIIKATRKQDDQAPEKKSSFPFGEIFPEYDEADPHHEESIIQETPAEPVTVEQEPSRDNKTEAKPVGNKMKQEVTITKHKNKSLQKILQKFDGKTAVIYAEIINPKYF